MLRLLVFLALFAAVLYAFFWLVDRRNTAGPQPPRPGGRGVRPTSRGPKGPDDDEDFLRELDRRRTHRQDDEA